LGFEEEEEEEQEVMEEEEADEGIYNDLWVFKSLNNSLKDQLESLNSNSSNNRQWISQSTMSSPLFLLQLRL
jgi:hypothetical protein